MTTAAVLAVAVAVGGWLGVRGERAVSNRSHADMAAYLLTIPADEWKR